MHSHAALQHTSAALVIKCPRRSNALFIWAGHVLTLFLLRCQPAMLAGAPRAGDFTSLESFKLLRCSHLSFVQDLYDHLARMPALREVDVSASVVGPALLELPACLSGLTKLVAEEVQQVRHACASHAAQGLTLCLLHRLACAHAVVCGNHST